MTGLEYSDLTSDQILQCYRQGIFPMAENRDSADIFLVDPKIRGIIPLDGLHISRSLKKTLKQNLFAVTFDTCFKQVMIECAKMTSDRSETWINEPILSLYCELHERGFGHSVEVWFEDKLVGGLYGLSIGAAFFGESMFSRRANASKVALVKLVEHLNDQNYQLLDTQFLTDHLARMGGIEISREDYHILLSRALDGKAVFTG